MCTLDFPALYQNANVMCFFSPSPLLGLLYLLCLLPDSLLGWLSATVLSLVCPFLVSALYESCTGEEKIENNIVQFKVHMLMTI